MFVFVGLLKVASLSAPARCTPPGSGLARTGRETKPRLHSLTNQKLKNSVARLTHSHHARIILPCVCPVY